MYYCLVVLPFPSFPEQDPTQTRPPSLPKTAFRFPPKSRRRKTPRSGITTASVSWFTISHELHLASDLPIRVDVPGKSRRSSPLISLDISLLSIHVLDRNENPRAPERDSRQVNELRKKLRSYGWLPRQSQPVPTSPMTFSANHGARSAIGGFADITACSDFSLSRGEKLPVC